MHTTVIKNYSFIHDGDPSEVVIINKNKEFKIDYEILESFVLTQISNQLINKIEEKSCNEELISKLEDENYIKKFLFKKLAK